MGNTPDFGSHNSSRSKRIAARRRKKEVLRKLQFILICVAGFVVLGSIVLTVRANSRPISITLKLNNTEIVQGEAIPAFKAAAVYKGKKENKIIDKKSKMTVKDLVKRLNSGKGYTISCEADTTVDNSYPVHISLDKSLKKKIKDDWNSRVNLNISTGKLTVKNMRGTWEKNKFKLNDSSYLASDFLDSGGKTYYFDENGEMVTGEQRIGLKTCVFDKNGVLKARKDTVIENDKPMVALTFDDGPAERTSELIDTLDKYNAHATFFMQGKNAAPFAETIQKMLDTGNELGNHSYNHPELTKLPADQIQKQISDTNAAIEAASGSAATVLRPPYGSINSSVSANVGMPMILWTVDTLDWKIMNAQATFDTTMASVSDGDIVLMHDVHSTSIDAALRIIPELTKQGYQLVTVSEMAAARAIGLENGKTYRDEL